MLKPSVYDRGQTGYITGKNTNRDVTVSQISEDIRALDVNITNAEIQVDVNIDDKIHIVGRNDIDTLDINQNGSINVVVSSPEGGLWSEYDMNFAVPPIVETTIVTFTVPIGQSLYVNGFVATGEADGIFTLKHNSNVLVEMRNSWTSRNVEYTPGNHGHEIPEGETIEIAVRHNEAINKWFSATLQGLLK